MAYAVEADVEVALRRDLTDDETATVGGVLDGASDLIDGYLYPCTVPDPTPGAVTRVVADIAAAVLSRPAGLMPDTSNMTAGPYQVGFASGSTSLGPYLTAALKQRLAPFRCGNGMASVQLGSERF